MIKSTLHKAFLTTILALFAWNGLSARERVTLPSIDTTMEVSIDSLFSLDSLTDEYLDTVNLRRKIVINDYFMVGAQYGVSFNRMMFNPGKNQGWLFRPVNFGFLFTKYLKMFGYMPYFGWQVGVFYGQDGYVTKMNEETGVRPSVDGAYSAIYDYIEVPVMSHFHFDVHDFKIMANLGFFGGYRFNVQRFGDAMDENYTNAFHEYDYKIDYGIKGGIGFGYVFGPIELHLTGQLRWGFSSLYQPDYNSPYYYRFAYPLDVIVSAGVHYQLVRRTGKTAKQLREEAKALVYGSTPSSIGMESSVDDKVEEIKDEEAEEIARQNHITVGEGGTIEQGKTEVLVEDDNVEQGKIDIENE